MASTSPPFQLQLQTEPKQLKYWKSLKALSIVILAIGILVLVLEIGMQFLIVELGGTTYAIPGVGIWGGILGIICGGLGIGAFRIRHGHKCLMVAHFVLAIFVILIDIGLIVGSCFLLAIVPRSVTNRMRYNAAEGRYEPYVVPHIERIMGYVMVVAAVLMLAGGLIQCKLPFLNYGTVPQKVPHFSFVLHNLDGLLLSQLGMWTE